MRAGIQDGAGINVRKSENRGSFRARSYYYYEYIDEISDISAYERPSGE